MNKVFDALIIGGGPAGLSAALALARVHRTCVVFSNAKYRNEGATAHSILTRDHTPSKDLLALGRKDIEKEFFGQKWTGRTVVMATGVRDIFPNLPGYIENWPHNIYQCLFCDGHERSGMPVGVLCYPKFNPMMVKMATMAHFQSMPAGTKSDGTSNVTLFTNGPVDTSDDATKSALDTCAAHGIKVDQRPVVKLEKATNTEGVYLHLTAPDSTTAKVFAGFIVHKPPTALAAPDLVEQLSLETTEGMFGKNIVANPPFQSTNVPGVFACGDTGVALTHVTNAMLTGNGAAAGVSHHCNELDDKEALVRYRGKEETNGVELQDGQADGTGCVEDVGGFKS